MVWDFLVETGMERMTSEKLLRTCDAWQRPVVGQGQKQLLAPKSCRPLLCAFAWPGSGDRSLAEGTQCLSPTSGPPPPPALFPGRLVWLARESLSHLRCQSRRQREPVCQEVPKGENSRGQRPMPPLPGVRTRSGLTTHLCLQAQVPSVLPVTCHLQRRDPGLRHLQEASAGPQRE